MKLCVKVPPLNIVVRYPASVPLVAIGTTVSVPDALFDSVSMPKINEPLTVAAPAAATEGSVMMVPLLSVANRVTGFGTWLASGTVVPAQFDSVVHA